MSINAQITNRESIALGVTILDKDGQPFDSLPAGISVDFVSSDPNIASVVPRADGMNADIHSGQNGTATITVTVNGITLPAGNTDTANITVVNSVPGSMNLTFGQVTEEPEA